MENYKIFKATQDLQSALDSLKELNNQERTAVLTAVFGADAVKYALDAYNLFLKRQGLN